MKVVRNLRYSILQGGVAVILLGILPQNVLAGELQSIRDEVRDPVDRSFSLFGGSKSEEDSNDDRRSRRDRSDYDSDPFSDDDEGNWELYKLGAIFTFHVAISPFTIPRALLGDDGEIGYFQKFPYRTGDGVLMIDQWSETPRRYSGRIRMEYCENYQDLWRAGGRSSSRRPRGSGSIPRHIVLKNGLGVDEPTTSG